jgi:hypothetical protein
MQTQRSNLQHFRQSRLRRTAATAVDGFAQRHPLRRAIARVRQVALAARHQLVPFRADETRDGFLFASCPRCGAGASIHLDTGVDSISDQLQQPCPDVPHKE